MSNEDYGDCLAIPPLDPTFPDFSDLDDDVFLDDPDFDFSLDDLLKDSLDFSPNPQFTNSQPNDLPLGCFLPQSQGSGNCGSHVSEAGDCCDGNSKGEVSSYKMEKSSDSSNIVSEEKNGSLKRKKDAGDSSNGDGKGEVGSCKLRKSSDMVSEEEKMKVRLMRNRESAHLSRQRRKQYVEGLEGKVRSMQSTIQELNAKIGYIIAENASLKQQIGGVVPAWMAMYPWMPAPPYGSQVPIPRIKSQQLAPAPKTSNKNGDKKSHGRTKKVASVSFLGLLFFMLLFGGLVPMVNVSYGRMKGSFMGRSGFVGNGHYEKHYGRVLTVDEERNSNFNCAMRNHSEGELKAKSGGCGFVGEGNGSEPLMASLYVPRNHKLVKIDGNLIIHSILASEKATRPGDDQQEKTSDETGLALLGDLIPSDPRRNAGRHSHLALGSGGESENLKITATDHQLHQWFREGLAGPMLSSGKCTEVFQFDVVSASAPGAIISANSARNVSTASSKNSTHVSRGRNRRILHGLPIPLPGSSTHNISEEATGRDAGNGNFPGTNSSSSMVVSVLLDPREAADAEVDGVMRVKSLSRIFVVVLIDGVKYVTYSCMFPFKGAAVPHLVTA